MKINIIFKFTVIFSISFFILITLDILANGSIYHPLIYIYNIWTWNNCRGSSFIHCKTQDNHNKNNIARGNRGVVVTAQHEASNVGIKILQNGGNAIDAAVGIGYALAVTHPCCGNLGGGGFMLIRFANGEKTLINFREKAPLAASSEMYLNKMGKVQSELSTSGYLSVAVPGTVKGLDYSLQKYGSLRRETVMAPAINLASNGYILRQGDVDIFNQQKEILKKDKNASKIFMNPKGELYKVGDILVQKDLARTLIKISNEGESVFYTGDIANEIIKANENNSGIITAEDLSTYRVSEKSPLECKYRSYNIITTPLPGGGVTLCQILNILQGYNLDTEEYNSTKNRHLILSAMLLSFHDRNRFLGDPEYIKSPTDTLLSLDYAKKQRLRIPQNSAIPINSLHVSPPNNEGQNTTHYSVIDRFGTSVSVTYTLNSYFGSSVIPGNTGFFLNNEMNDFTSKPGVPNKFGLVQSSNNSIEPGKQPLSSMSPTIVERNGKLVFVTGSPGGPTIITTLAQVLINHIDYGMNLNDSVNSPRIHYQGLPNFVLSEPNSLNSRAVIDLWEMGYRVIPYKPWGAAESAGIISDSVRIGVNDHRRPAGKALSYSRRQLR